MLRMNITASIFSFFTFYVSQKRGVDDRNSLPFFPYRDDGEVMYDAIGAMVKDYINM